MWERYQKFLKDVEDRPHFIPLFSCFSELMNDFRDVVLLQRANYIRNSCQPIEAEKNLITRNNMRNKFSMALEGNTNRDLLGLLDQIWQTERRDGSV